jgi:hypothetical protein
MVVLPKVIGLTGNYYTSLTFVSPIRAGRLRAVVVSRLVIYVTCTKYVICRRGFFMSVASCLVCILCHTCLVLLPTNNQPWGSTKGFGIGQARHELLACVAG